MTRGIDFGLDFDDADETTPDDDVEYSGIEYAAIAFKESTEQALVRIARTAVDWKEDDQCDRCNGTGYTASGRFCSCTTGVALKSDHDKRTDKKPMVSREDYEQARAVLDALPPGYYVKCCKCGGWFSGGRYRSSLDGPVCQTRCS